MVGKLPNCSQAQRSRTEERKRDLWIRQSPPKLKPSYAPGTESQRCKRGWMSENQILLEDRKKYFCLDIPFYRTFPLHQQSWREPRFCDETAKDGAPRFLR